MAKIVIRKFLKGEIFTRTVKNKTKYIVLKAFWVELSEDQRYYYVMYKGDNGVDNSFKRFDDVMDFLTTNDFIKEV